MQIASLDGTLGQLASLDAWLGALGIAPKKDRWHEAVEIVRRAREQLEKVESGGKRAFIENYVSGLFDATEAAGIVRAFSGDVSAALRDKVGRALSGPIAPLQELPRNSVARNAMFELSLAADWKNRGVTVEMGEPDILLHLGGVVFQVECKRPFYVRSVLANIRDAASQLGKELEKPANGAAFGIIAISLSRAFTQGNLLCDAPEGEGRRVIKETLAELIEKHRQEWRIKSFLDFHQRIVAVMFHLTAPWDIKGERLINLSHAQFIQAGKSIKGWHTLLNNMAGLY